MCALCVIWAREQQFSDSDVLGVVQTCFLSQFYYCVTLSKFFSSRGVQFLLLWNGNSCKDSMRPCVANTWQHPGTQKELSVTGRDILFIYQKPPFCRAERHRKCALILLRVRLAPFPLAKSRGSWSTRSQAGKASRMVSIYVAAASPWFFPPDLHCIISSQWDSDN